MKVLKPSRRKPTKAEGRAQSILDNASSRTNTSGDQATDLSVRHSTEFDIDDFPSDFEKTDTVKNHSTPRKKSRKNGAKPTNENVGGQSPKSDYDALMHKAVHLLSMREHSVQELQIKLYAKTDNPVVVDEVMRFLLEQDYVSDARFTEAFVRSRANKGQGPIKIRSDLKGKGVKTQIIDDHMDMNSACWFDQAENLYHKKYGDEPVKDYNTWSKRARFMQSRGFTMEHIHSTVPQADGD